MNRSYPLPALVAALGFVLFTAWLPAPALAASAAQLDRDARAALSKLYAKTPKAKVYAFIFDQKGAMAALGIQGNKITKIKK